LTCDPASLREKVIEKLVVMLQNNPLEYFDATRELDNGPWIKSFKKKDGEWCVKFVQYNAEQTDVNVTSNELLDPDLPLCAQLSHSGSESDD